MDGPTITSTRRGKAVRKQMKTQNGNHSRTATWDRLNRLRKQRRVQNFATFGLVAMGPVLAVLTYMGLGPFELDPTSHGIRLILLADLVYVLAVATLVAQKVGNIVASRRANSAGSQLHLRLTGGLPSSP